MQEKKPEFDREGNKIPDPNKSYANIYWINLALTLFSMITLVGVPIYFLVGIGYLIYAHTQNDPKLVKTVWINALITLVAVPLVGFSFCNSMFN